MFVNIINKPSGFHSDFIAEDGRVLSEMFTNFYPTPEEILGRLKRIPEQGCEECEEFGNRCPECILYEEIEVHDPVTYYVLKMEEWV